MEANPVVPENAPDKTSNFSFQDQQAAQPETQDEEGEKSLEWKVKRKM